MRNEMESIIYEEYFGYSDKILESLGEAKFEAGIAPWVAWESENSSFGKTFRKWACYPRVFPLFFSSDHGVHWESRCWPNEVDSRFKVFFTWNKKKNNYMRNQHGKKSFYIQHPWIAYRKKYFPHLPLVRLGTLVFFPHSNVYTSPAYNMEKYVQDLKNLPDKYQPIVICLLSDDIKKGLHKQLRKYNIPIITAGALSSQEFVDRFYSMVYKFKYCTSSNIGSHVFYIVEAGIPFFLYGQYPEYLIKGSNAVKDGKQDLKDYGDEEDILNLSKIKDVFLAQVDTVTLEQHEIVSKYLGMDSKMSRFRGAAIIWSQFFLNFNELFLLYAGLFVRFVKKIQND